MFKRKFPFEDVNPNQSKLYVNSKVFNDISSSSDFEKKLIYERTIKSLKDGCKALKRNDFLNGENVSDVKLMETKIDKHQMTINFNGQLSRSPMKIASNQSTKMSVELNNNASTSRCSSCKFCADEISTCTWCCIEICNHCCRYCILCENFYCHLCSILEYSTINDQEAYCLQCIGNISQH